MTTSPPNGYDETVYKGKPYSATHPDNLATVATLFGMRPAHPSKCRVLELGCGTGENLIPMALTSPDSDFVGLDSSPRQIAIGTEIAAKVGLRNIELHARDLRDVPPDWGRFDYIVSHGVLSWTPRPVQDALLAICRDHLAPSGVAYVSYNCYPGWHARRAARDLMMYRGRSVPDPHQRVRAAKDVLRFVRDNAFAGAETLHRILCDEAEFMGNLDDCYILHDQLEATNDPIYFHEFVDRLAANGLRYLAEARNNSRPDLLSKESRALLAGMVHDRIEEEQYLDFLSNRMFRASLACRDDVPLTIPPRADAVMSLYVEAQALPTAPGPRLADDSFVEFVTRKAGSFSTNIPLAKAALVVLHEHRPACMTFAALVEEAGARLAAEQGSPYRERGPDRLLLAAFLLKSFLAKAVGLHVCPPPLVSVPGSRPFASPLARVQAASASRVTSLRHKMVDIDDVLRRLLPLLDGTRDRDALLHELSKAPQGAGEINDSKSSEEGESRDQTRVELEALLGKCAELGLLMQ